MVFLFRCNVSFFGLHLPLHYLYQICLFLQKAFILARRHFDFGINFQYLYFPVLEIIHGHIVICILSFKLSRACVAFKIQSYGCNKF